MKKYNYLTKFLFLALMFVGISTYAQDKNQTIYENLQNTEDYTQFIAYAEQANIENWLDREDKEFTVLAPTNTALESLPSNIKDSESQLKDFLGVHIFQVELDEGSLYDKIEEKGGKMMLKAVSGKFSEVYIDEDDNVMLITPQGERVTLEKVSENTNGEVYKLDESIEHP